MANGTIAFDILSTSGQISGTAKSLDTDYVVNGSAKAWVNYDLNGTSAYRVSFNASSLTDNGTGDGTTTFSNNFDSADYSVSGMAGRQGASADPFLRFGDNSTAPTSSTVRLVCSGDNGTEYDVDRNSASAHGDLA